MRTSRNEAYIRKLKRNKCDILGYFRLTMKVN